jgi:mRNA-degrading endonuclease RelE of RelBE toxin-antitoxin system
MNFELEFTNEAEKNLKDLETDNSKKAEYKAVKRRLGFLETNPKHPSLKSKPYQSLKGPNGEIVFESYAENETPGAYRIFWYYDKEKRGIINVAAIVPHPD